MIFSNRFPSYMYNMHAKILYIMSLLWGFITVFFKLVDLFHFCRKIIYTECFNRFKASDNIVHEQHTNHKQWRLIWIVFSFLYMFLNVSDISNIVHTCALKLTKWLNGPYMLTCIFPSQVFLIRSATHSGTHSQ